jgi:hypothetical protein
MKVEFIKYLSVSPKATLQIVTAKQITTTTTKSHNPCRESFLPILLSEIKIFSTFWECFYFFVAIRLLQVRGFSSYSISIIPLKIIGFYND